MSEPTRLCYSGPIVNHDTGRLFSRGFLELTTRVLSSCCFFFPNRELTTRLFARGTFQYSRAHCQYRLITLRVQGFPSYPSSTISRLPNGHAVGGPHLWGLIPFVPRACGAFPSRTCGAATFLGDHSIGFFRFVPLSLPLFVSLPSYSSSSISRLPNGHAVGGPHLWGLIPFVPRACGAFPSRTCGGLLLGTIPLGSFVLSH